MRRVEAGVAKDKRRDAKLAKVIINEKRVKKVPSSLLPSLPSLSFPVPFIIPSFLPSLFRMTLFSTAPRSSIYVGKREREREDMLTCNAQNASFNATVLPHPFESRAQYERSLRLPVGPEWTTKTTFQAATMPRVMVKQGSVVEPMAAPFK